MPACHVPFVPRRWPAYGAYFDAICCMSVMSQRLTSPSLVCLTRHCLCFLSVTCHPHREFGSNFAATDDRILQHASLLLKLFIVFCNILYVILGLRLRPPKTRRIFALSEHTTLTTDDSKALYRKIH